MLYCTYDVARSPFPFREFAACDTAVYASVYISRCTIGICLSDHSIPNVLELTVRWVTKSNDAVSLPSVELLIRVCSVQPMTDTGLIDVYSRILAILRLELAIFCLVKLVAWNHGSSTGERYAVCFDRKNRLTTTPGFRRASIGAKELPSCGWFLDSVKLVASTLCLYFSIRLMYRWLGDAYAIWFDGIKRVREERQAEPVGRW